MNNFNLTLGKHNNSMNFFFGLNGLAADFDILNNPYVEYIGYDEVLDGETKLMTREQKYELENCQDDFFDSLGVALYYP